MALACRVRPKVLNKKNELVDSKLHADLELFTMNKNDTSHVWELSRSNEFKDKYKDLAKDENGEFFAEDVLGRTELGRLVDDKNVVFALNNIRGKQKTLSHDNILSLAKEAVDYNMNGSFKDRVCAVVSGIKETGKSLLSFDVLNESNKQYVEKLNKRLTIRERLVNFVEKHGGAIGQVSNAEMSQGVNGFIDLSSTERTAQGLRVVMRLAKGEKGQEALPEETAHLLIETLEGRNNNVDRILNLLKNNKELVKTILGDKYEQYNEAYNGNEDMLIHEAAGHVLRDALTDESTIENSSTTSKYKSLWGRVVDAIKNFVSKFTNEEVDDVLGIIRSSAKQIAKDTLNDSFDVEIDFSKEIEHSRKLLQISEEYQNELKDRVERLIKNTESQRQKIPAFQISYQLKNNIKGQYYHLGKLLDALNMYNDRAEADSGNGNNSMLAIMTCLDKMSRDLYYHLTTFKDRYDKSSSLGKAYIINNIVELCKIYKSINKDISSLLREIKDQIETENDKEIYNRIQQFLKGYEDQDPGENTTHHIDGISQLIEEIEMEIQPYKIKAIKDYLEIFLGTDMDNIPKVVIPEGATLYGKQEGEKIDVIDLMTGCPDIGGVDHWMLGGALSNSLPIQIVQRIVSTHKLKARQIWRDYMRELQELTINLEKNGYKNQEFMYERDKDGKLTGKFIKKDSEAYNKLHEIQREYYDNVIRIKKELDAMLPLNMRNLLNAPKVRKDFLSRIQADGNVWNAVKGKLNETFNIDADDEYNIEKDVTVVDYDGHSVNVVPIRFLQLAPGESMDLMSTDIVGSMTKYAQMCANYSMMSQVAPVLELMQNFMSESSEVTVDRNGNERREKRKDKTGGNNMLDKINDIIETQVYGIRPDDSRTDILGKNINMSKIGRALLGFASYTQYMLSPLAAIQNSITATIQSALEASDNRYFGMSDLSWAHSMFSKNLLDILGDVSKRIPQSKMYLFCDMFNISMKDNIKEFNHKGLGRLSPEDAYFMTSSGEFNSNTVIALSLAHNTKLKDKDGKEINLYDALEVVDRKEKVKRDIEMFRKLGEQKKVERLESELEKHPEWSGSETKYLVLKEGVTKLDGSEFSIYDTKGVSDLESFTRKFMHISHMCNGVYNNEDSAKWQRYTGGQLIGMYRKWIAPMWYKRMNQLNYNIDTGELDEGYYRTLVRVLSNRISNVRTKGIASIFTKGDLQDFELKNLRRAAIEMAMYVLLLYATRLMKATMKNKKHKCSYMYNLAYYFAVRTMTEVGALNPVGIVGETVRIMQSPTAVLPVINNTLSLASCVLEPWYAFGFDEDDLVKSGKYKGMSEIERVFAKLKLDPYNNLKWKWYAFTHPEEAVRFYES